MQMMTMLPPPVPADDDDDDKDDDDSDDVRPHDDNSHNNRFGLSVCPRQSSSPIPYHLIGRQTSQFGFRFIDFTFHIQSNQLAKLANSTDTTFNANAPTMVQFTSVAARHRT